MTSTLMASVQKQTILMIGSVSVSHMGRDYKNPECFADVIYGWSIMMREERGREEGSKR